MPQANKIPRHIGFIMDGNGRWAEKHGKSRNYGHSKGADRVESVVQNCFDAGVECVSLYAFSTENWGRPQDEIDKLFSLLKKFLKKFTPTLVKNKIRLLISGDVSVLSDDFKTQIADSINKTKEFTKNTLNIALNYGGRQELTNAVNLLIRSGAKEVSEEDISKSLYTNGLPDIDLMVRTSGEQRISNFFLWQIAYAELYFTDTLWPDFDKEELDKALLAYSKRNRRFGKI